MINKKYLVTIVSTLALIYCTNSCNEKSTQETVVASEMSLEPLPSWQEGQTKAAIVDFVEDVTNPQSQNYVDVRDRIATFDNDGNLWSEQPLYFQMIFALDRVKQLAPEHPEWKNEQPYKAVLCHIDYRPTFFIGFIQAFVQPPNM